MLVREDTKHLACDRGAERVAAERVAVEERPIARAAEAVVDPRRRERRAHREHAARETLRGAEEIGRHPRVIDRPEAPGAAVAGEDLVRDQEDVVPIAERARLGEVLRGVDAHPRRALDERLEDDRRDLVRARADHAREIFERARVRRRIVGGEDTDAVEEEPRERAPEDLDARQRRSADRVSVERALERDEALSRGTTRLAPVLRGELHRRLHRGRPVVDEERAREAGRRDADDLFREAGGRLVGDPPEGAVSERARLLGERTDEARMTVAERGDPPRRVRVEVAPPVDVEEPRSLGPRDDEGLARLPLVGGRVRVPEVLAVEPDELVARRHAGTPPEIGPDSLFRGGALS